VIQIEKSASPPSQRDAADFSIITTSSMLCKAFAHNAKGTMSKARRAQGPRSGQAGGFSKSVAGGGRSFCDPRAHRTPVERHIRGRRRPARSRKVSRAPRGACAQAKQKLTRRHMHGHICNGTSPSPVNWLLGSPRKRQRRSDARLARDVARAARGSLAGVGGREPFDHGRGLGHRRRADARRLEPKHAGSRRSYLAQFQRV